MISKLGSRAVDAEGFGCEASGIITHVGSNIPEERLGQRVAFYRSGCFTTSLRMPSERCLEFPDELSFEEAASMPAAYCTAMYCLIERACAQSGMVSYRVILYCSMSKDSTLCQDLYHY